MSSETWAWSLLRLTTGLDTCRRSLVYNEVVFGSKFSHMMYVTEADVQTLLAETLLLSGQQLTRAKPEAAKVKSQSLVHNFFTSHCVPDCNMMKICVQPVSEDRTSWLDTADT